MVPSTFIVGAISENTGRSGIDSVGAVTTSSVGTSGIVTVGAFGGSTNVGMVKLGSATSSMVGIVGSVISGVLGIFISGTVMSLGVNDENASVGASGTVPNDGEYMSPTVTVLLATLGALIVTGENVVVGNMKSSGLYTAGIVGLVRTAAGTVILGAVIAGTVIGAGVIIGGTTTGIGENAPGPDCSTGGGPIGVIVGCAPASVPIFVSASATPFIAFSIAVVSKSLTSYLVVLAAASALAESMY
jgi:hypothetical protein